MYPFSAWTGQSSSLLPPVSKQASWRGKEWLADDREKCCIRTESNTWTSWIPTATRLMNQQSMNFIYAFGQSHGQEEPCHFRQTLKKLPHDHISTFDFFFLCARQSCLFLTVSQWHILSTNYSTNSKNINGKSCPVSCNLSPTVTIYNICHKYVAIVYIRMSSRVHCSIDTITKQFDCLIHTQWLDLIMALTHSLTQIFSFVR